MTQNGEQRAQANGGTRPRSAFTVLELVVVVGVLAVLLAVLFPTFTSARTSTLRKQAVGQATVLAQAAIRYKDEYGFWPGQLRAQGDDAVRLDDAFKSGWTPVIIARAPDSTFTVASSGGEPVYIDEEEVFRAFRRVGRKQGNTYLPNPLNPRGIAFLDLDGETDADRVSYRDPWGRSFVLMMGLNPRSTFTHTVSFPGGASQTVHIKNNVAFAFSYGPEGSSSTNYLYSAGARP